MQSSGKTKLVELNELLTCVLCKGYFIDATTIVECLHSFCRTCIVRYLHTNKFCPSCEVQVHKTRPLLNIRSDQTLQDIVYKLVPGLFKNEMKRRRDYYQQQDALVQNSIPSSSEKRGDVWGCDRLIFTPEDIISVSLEYSPLNEQLPVNLQTNMFPPEKKKVMQYYKRYFNCPGALKVYHLKKLLQAKYGLIGSKKKVDILYMHDLLKDQYTLVDLAYIYSWKRSKPLRLFFKITRESPETDLGESLETSPPSLPIPCYSPSTAAIPTASSMAATPSSRHPSPPPSPQMAQEPNDIRVGKPNPAAMRSGRSTNVPTAVVPLPNGLRVGKPNNGQNGHDTKLQNAAIPEQNKRSVHSLNVPAMIIPKPSEKVNGVLADRTVSEANLKEAPDKSTAQLGNIQKHLVHDDKFAKISMTTASMPKLKSALKKAAADVVSPPIKINAKRRFSMDSQLSKRHIPASNVLQSKKRVTFSVNLVQDCQGSKRKVPDYFDDASPFKLDPVNGSAIGGIIHLRKKVLSHKSS